MKQDKFILLWVYIDSPCVIRNPPKNLPNLLRTWNKLDRCDDDAPGWKPVNEWLKDQGVDILKIDQQINLDAYDYLSKEVPCPIEPRDLNDMPS